MVCLLLLFDAVDSTITISTDDKLAEVVKICELWSRKHVCYKTELQFLLGSLLYVQCVKPVRIFPNQMLHFLRQFDESNADRVNLTLDFGKDLQ